MKSFIFDLNGTLYQDTDIHYRAWGIFCARHNVPYSKDVFYKYMYGPENLVILRNVMPEVGTDDERRALSEEKEVIYRDLVASDPALQTLTPGAPEVLDRLAAEGVPFAIATGATRSNCEFYMDVLDLKRWFDFDRIFCADGSLPGKPDPAVYVEAMRHLGYAVSETIVAEDSPAGIASAVAAGIRTIIAVDVTLGADAYAHIPQVRAVVHDFYGMLPFIDGAK